MQRQTGCRIKAAPTAPPIQPVAANELKEHKKQLKEHKEHLPAAPRLQPGSQDCDADHCQDASRHDATQPED